MSNGTVTDISERGMNVDALDHNARRENRQLMGLSGPALCLVGMIAFLPTAWLFWLSIVGENGLTLEHYRRLIDNASYFRIFSQTLELSFLVTVLTIILGYPLAYMISQLPKFWASIALIGVMLPFWTSLLVRTYAWMVLLQRRGLVNDWLMTLGLIDRPLRLVHNYTGTVIGMLHIMLPFLILPVLSALRGIDRDYMKAAANLGASPSVAFWTVFFPLSLPGVIAGSLLVFILCLGFYVTPALLGGGKVMTVSMKLQQNAAIYFDWGAASSLGVVLLVVTLAIFWVLNRLFSIERIFAGK
jgi:putative spermidine/putrescine transport system permease protein/spermidine/putrescine transport system permease protein